MFYQISLHLDEEDENYLLMLLRKGRDHFSICEEMYNYVTEIVLERLYVYKYDAKEWWD